jgi:hypothetical protein
MNSNILVNSCSKSLIVNSNRYVIRPSSMHKFDQTFASYTVPTVNMISMLLVSRSGLVEEDAVEVIHYYGFHLSSSFLK